MAEWYVYIVQCADGNLYTGIAKDVDDRVSQHNAGQGAKYTRARRPVVLVYQEVAKDHGAALRRENAIRRLRPETKRVLVAEFSKHLKSEQEYQLAEQLNPKEIVSFKEKK